MKIPFGNLLWILALALIVGLTYQTALDNEFVNWDDNSHLTHNVFIRPLDGPGVREIFTSQVDDIYVPLTLLSFAVEYHFFQDDPFVYHLNNVLLHVAVTGLVFYLAVLCGLSPSGAGLAALIFGLHPMHVESVAWVTERKDVLFAFFYLAALCGYIGYLRRVQCTGYSFFSWFAFTAIVVLGVLSVLAKSMAVTLPLVLLAVDWYFSRPLSRRTLLEKAYLAVFMIPIAWRTVVLSADKLGPWQFKNICLWIWSFIFYLKKFLWPDFYTLFYHRPVGCLECWPALIVFLVLLGLVAKWRKRRWLVFTFLFYAASILPVIRLVEINTHAARYIYIPSVGLCLALAWVWEYAWSRGRTVFLKAFFVLVTGGFTAFLIVKTVSQIEVWQNSTNLWQHQLKTQPLAATGLAHNKLGWALLERKDFFPANTTCAARIEGYFRRAIAINPYLDTSFQGLAELYLQLGRLDKAEKYFLKTLQVNSGNFEAVFGLGRLYYAGGQKARGLEMFQKAMALKPDNVLLYNKIQRFYGTHPPADPAERVFWQAMQKRFEHGR